MIKYSRFTLLILFIVTLLVLQSCKVNPAIKVPYVSYYRGDNTMLYFIKPMNLYENENSMSIDFTFIDKKETDSASVTVNYTINNCSKSKNDIFYLKIDSTKHKLEDATVIFEEIQKGKRVTRYTSKIHQKLMLEILEKSYFQFVIENGNADRVYKISRKYEKKLKQTSTDIKAIVKEKFE